MTDDTMGVQVTVSATLRKWEPGANPDTDEPSEVIETTQLVTVTPEEAQAMQEAASGT